MLWAIAAAGLTGVLLGLSLRVSAVIVGSLAIMVGGVVVSPFIAWSFLTTALVSFEAVCSFQLGYLSGLAVSCAWSRLNLAPLKALLSKADDVPVTAPRRVLVDRRGLR